MLRKILLSAVQNSFLTRACIIGKFAVYTFASLQPFEKGQITFKSTSLYLNENSLKVVSVACH